VRVLAYYPNLILIAAFLGLGLGCLRAGRRSLLWAWPVTLAVVVAVAALLSRVVFTQEAAADHLFLLYYDLPASAPVVSDIRPPVLLLFVLAAASFVPVGQIVAERLTQFRAQGRPLSGYAWDIGGSLAGVGGFTALSFAGAFPVVWFAAVLLLGGTFFRHRRRDLGPYGAAAVLVLVMVAGVERAERYSPYYAVATRDRGAAAGFEITTNGSLHQVALPLRRRDQLAGDDARIRDGYHVPYALLTRPIRRALVVGAGSGNDVAVLLDHGAEQVDAIEIDPVILELGRTRHPSRPYASPRVRAINTDARSWLNDTSETYDVIVFGTLDSMTRLSALSTVRLDAFMYTADCLRAARTRLTPEGGLVLYFMVGSPYIDLRLAGLLTAVFGETPLVDDTDRRLFNRIYMAGPAFAAAGGEERRADAGRVLARVRTQVELPTDDWPYLYLKDRGLSGFYLSMMAGVAVIALGGALLASPDLRRSATAGGADGEMLLFGLAFLLLETRSVTAMNLAWGATWLTSAIVFFAVLTMVLVATFAVRAWSPPLVATVALLVAALVVVYLLPEGVVLRAGVAPRLALSLLLVGIPVFLASVAFARLFEGRPDPGVAFGWNLLGAVAGGLLELLSMATGLRALLLVAAAAYLAALLLAVRARQAVRIRATAA
jgi:spermidine synthase